MPPAGLDAVKHAALWFEEGPDGLAPLIDAIGDAKVVLIGEASHGTAEFYRVRADLTSALIERKGFNIVAAEADWPDAYRVNRWVRHMSDDSGAIAALDDFHRFPRWMWRNDVVVDFVTWLRWFNSSRAADRRCGWYGLDLYSLHRSMGAVLEYLGKVDPNAARRARERYACFGQLARITEQFDALIHIDVTSALTPLEPWSGREADLPETYPTGV
jgi:erythromycin esterase-like protein